MPSEERESRDPLESLIADVLESENRGEPVDRDALIAEHPDLAESLRDFFGTHDRMKSAADQEEPTLPPREGVLDDPTIPPQAGSLDEPTVPPRSEREDPTIPPTEPATNDGPTVGDQVRYFGDYELLEEIARGGMGVVFKARQINLNRIVALKMILAGQFAGEEDVQRFYTEAEAAAQLDHPGIVPIFEIGEHQGQHYFSMGYVEGESLAQRVADGPLPPREAADLVKMICDAMAYAHERGVIHRDLKPANILIDLNGQPKVTDFGLAKKTEADSNLTGTGQILGTPAYMPPEQASGKADVGPLADVYSLGAILYCLLTGRPPFQAASPMDTLLQVIDKDPISPRHLNPTLPRDLETICVKALIKDPRKRYSSASILRADLQRFRNGEPIEARPIGRLEKTWLWSRRNPALSAATCALITLALGISIISPIVAFRQKKLRDNAEANAETARREKIKALYERDRASQAQRRAEEQEKSAKLRLYASQISSSQVAWDADNAPVALSKLNNTDVALRGWEFDYLETRFTKGSSDLIAKPTKIASAVRGVAFSPDGRRIASKNMNTIKFWDPVSLRESYSIETGFFANSDIEFSPDGLWVFCEGPSSSSTSTGTLRVWKTDDGTVVRTLPASGSISDVASNRSLIVAAASKGIDVFDLRTGTKQATLEKLGVSRVDLSSDGSTIAGGANDGSIQLWDGKTYELLRTIDGHISHVTSVAISPDGNMLATASTDKSCKIWKLDTGTEVVSLTGHNAAVNCIAFRPDGKQIATGSKDATIKEWDAVTGELLFTRTGHVRDVECLAYSPDGTKLISGSASGKLKMWDVADRADGDIILHETPVQSVSFSPSGEAIVSTSVGMNSPSLTYPMKVSFPWRTDLHSQSITYWPFYYWPPTKCVAFDPGGESYATGGKVPRIWSVASNRYWGFQDHQGTVTCIAFSPDGKIVVFGCSDNTIRFWALPARKHLRTVSVHEKPVLAVAFSPDGSKIVISGADKQISVWEVKNVVNFSLKDRWSTSSWQTCLAVSPDGGRLISGGFDKAVSVWDIESGELLRSLAGHADRVNGVCISPDGSRIVSGSKDKTIKVWDFDTGIEMITLGSHADSVNDVAFNTSGTHLASASSDQTVRIWSTQLSHNKADDHHLQSPIIQQPAGSVYSDGIRFVVPMDVDEPRWILPKERTPGVMRFLVTIPLQLQGRSYKIQLRTVGNQGTPEGQGNVRSLRELMNSGEVKIALAEQTSSSRTSSTWRNVDAQIVADASASGLVITLLGQEWSDKFMLAGLGSLRVLVHDGQFNQFVRNQVLGMKNETTLALPPKR